MQSFWLIIGGKNFKTGENIPDRRLGPYASEQEAEDAERSFWQEIDDRHWDSVRDYVYHAHIEVEPSAE